MTRTHSCCNLTQPIYAENQKLFKETAQRHSRKHGKRFIFQVNEHRCDINVSFHQTVDLLIKGHRKLEIWFPSRRDHLSPEINHVSRLPSEKYLIKLFLTIGLEKKLTENWPNIHAFSLDKVPRDMNVKRKTKAWPWHFFPKKAQPFFLCFVKRGMYLVKKCAKRVLCPSSPFSFAPPRLVCGFHFKWATFTGPSTLPDPPVCRQQSSTSQVPPPTPLPTHIWYITRAYPQPQILHPLSGEFSLWVGIFLRVFENCRCQLVLNILNS